MLGIGYQEMVVLLVIVLIIFGPKNLPKLAKSMGSAIRDFKSGLSGVEKDIEDAANAENAPVETRATIEPKSPAESVRQTAKEHTDRA